VFSGPYRTSQDHASHGIPYRGHAETVKRKPRVLPFRPKAQPSIFDVPGGLKLSCTVTVERVTPEVRFIPVKDRRGLLGTAASGIPANKSTPTD
jgi:hypothetical protein